MLLARSSTLIMNRLWCMPCGVSGSCVSRGAPFGFLVRIDFLRGDLLIRGVGFGSRDHTRARLIRHREEPAPPAPSAARPGLGAPVRSCGARSDTTSAAHSAALR